ncbi:MAG: hypothetical protein K2X37_08725 [Chitinophagaceae bacterium]|nr:hypothetical protein [Chitinophagaceae bacterium]
MRAFYIISLFVFASCASYNNKLSVYYNHVGSGNYAKAQSDLSSNSFINQERNKLLFYFEQGKLCHLQGLYDSSNKFFNLADAFLEEKRKNAGDAIKANLLNPMTQTYLGEDFERFMIHYYKALNYLYLNEPDGARVEARRITLSNTALEDKFRPTSNRYKEDAFSLIVQGLVYELSGEANNAFISYRNAVDLFLKDPGQVYYGTKLPKELVQDLYKTAMQVGFNDQVQLYERKTGIEYKKSEAAEGGELVLFIEKGMAPVKIDQRLTATNNGSGVFFVNGPYGGISFPIDNGYIPPNKQNSINEFRVITVSLPVYAPQTLRFEPTVISINQKNFTAEPVHSINDLAPEILKERLGKEIAAAVLRAIIKRSTEAVAAEAARAAAKSSTKDEKKKGVNGEAAALTAGLLMNVFNTATEKADTRNWQSLPAAIQYVRIPLQKGTNEITINAMGKQKKITINGRGGLQLYNWCLLK